MPYRYHLDSSSKKFECPSCGKKRFVRYVDSVNGNYMKTVYGRCDREVKCGYHRAPEGNDKIAHSNPISPKTPFFVDRRVFKRTLSNYKQNHLFSFVASLFGVSKAQEIFLRYQVGTSKHWEGATLFWQINSNGQIGQGKIMLFDCETGKRIKYPFPHITSVHKQLGKQDHKPEYCFFGEHLLSVFPNKPIAMVESEKTALIMSAIEPCYLWIASGGLSQLTVKRMNPMKGHRIVFYPDLGAFDRWREKAVEINSFGFNITVSTLLESKATLNDRQDGFDIADFIVENLIVSKYRERELQRIIEKNHHVESLISRFQLMLDN